MIKINPNQMKVEVSANCGNSPKQEFIKKFNIAFAKADIDFLTSSVSDDITWEIVGDKTIKGKEAFRHAVSEMANYPAAKLVLHQVITHGKEAASNGAMYMQDDPETPYCFSDFYEFISPGKQIIKNMRSYVIKSSES